VLPFRKRVSWWNVKVIEGSWTMLLGLAHMIGNYLGGTSTVNIADADHNISLLQGADVAHGRPDTVRRWGPLSRPLSRGSKPPKRPPSLSL
jgi:hypothetical protein